MSVEDESAISSVEAAVLADQEAIITQGLKTFYAVGTALLTIRDQRLYREDHGTFEDYCQGRWGMTHRNANYLIGAATVVDDLGNTFPILPSNARQASPLAALPPKQRAAAWQEAVQTAPEGKVTAAHVAATVRDILHPPASEPEEASFTYPARDEAEWHTSGDAAPAYAAIPRVNPDTLRHFPARPSLVPAPTPTPESEPGAYSRYALLEQYNGAIGRVLTAARYAKDLYRHTPSDDMAEHLTDQEESDDDAIILDFTAWVRAVILARQSGVKVRRVK